MFAVGFALTWLVFAGLVAWWAAVWGRSWPLFLLLAFLLSPLIAGIVLLILGRKGEAQAPVFDAPDGGGKMTVCPHCGHRQPVAFEDAKAERMTCEQCWKSFPIRV